MDSKAKQGRHFARPALLVPCCIARFSSLASRILRLEGVMMFKAFGFVN